MSLSFYALNDQADRDRALESSGKIVVDWGRKRDSYDDFMGLVLKFNIKEYSERKEKRA